MTQDPKRKRSRKKKRSYFAKARAIAIKRTLLVVSLVGLVTFGIIQLLPDWESPVDETLTNREANTLTLEQLLERGSADQLAKRLSVPFEFKSESTVLRCNEIEEQLRIVGRMRELPDASSFQERIDLGQLSALIAREKIRLAEPEAVASKPAQLLIDFAESKVNSSTGQVASLATTGKTIGFISQFLQSKNELSVVEAEFKKVKSGEGNFHPLTVTKQMSDWIRLLEQQGYDQQAMDLYQLFIQSFNATEEDEIARLVSAAKTKLFTREIDPQNFVSQTADRQNDAIAQFLEMANNALDSDVEASQLIELIKKSGELVVLGKKNQAEELIAKIKLKTNVDQSSELKRWLDSFDKRAALTGTAFPLARFKKLDNSQVSFKVKRAEVRLVFVFDKLDRRKTVQDFLSLVERNRQELKSGTLEFASVLVDDQQSKDEKRKLLATEMNTNLWRVWLLDVGQDQAGALATFGVVEPPFLILLDRDNKIVSIGNSVEAMQEAMFNLKMAQHAAKNAK